MFVTPGSRATRQRIAPTAGSTVAGTLGPFTVDQITYANSSNTIAGSSVFYYDGAGHVLLGSSFSVPLVDQMSLQIPGTTFATAGAGFSRWANTATSVASLILAKSRGATIGTPGLLLQDDNAGRIYFRGNDGVNFWDGAFIQGDVDGVAALNSMPFRLVFSTTPLGATFPVERMRIDNFGTAVFVGNTTLPGVSIPTDSFGDQSYAQVYNPPGRFGFSVFGFAGAGGGEMVLSGTRGTTPSSRVVVRLNDTLGAISFAGDDGTHIINTAGVFGIVDGAVSSGQLPTRLSFATGGSTAGDYQYTERLRLASNGNAGFNGYVAASEFSFIPSYQFNNSNTNVMINSWGNSAAGGSELYFNLSNGTTTPGTQGLVGNGNIVAFIDFTASDGIAFNSVARFLVDIDGPTSSGHVPGRYRFLTATSGNPVERLRIDNAGQMWVMTSGVSSTPAGARGSINETVALYNHQGMGGL